MMLGHAAWEAAVLPLNYARDGVKISGGGAGRQEGGGRCGMLRRVARGGWESLIGFAGLLNLLGSASGNVQIAQPRLGSLGLWPKRLL